jgi:hypothetical protein
LQLREAAEALTEQFAEVERPANQDVVRPGMGRWDQATDGELKVRIKAYFEARHGQTVYPSDVAEELPIDYDRAVKLIGELERDGQVARV